MKRTIALLLAVIMLLIVCSCDKKINPPIDGTETSSNGSDTNPPETTKEHKITYSKGRETASGRAPATQTAETGDTVEIAKNTFSEYGQCFTEWTDGETTYQQGEIITMPDKDLELEAVWGEGGSTMVIEDGSSINGWWGATAVYHGADGDGAQWNGTRGNDCLVFCNKYDAPIDVSRFEKDGYIHIRLWVENADLVKSNTATDGMFEFWDQDSEATSWSILDDDLVTGWNDIKIRMRESWSDKGDMKNVTSFRLFLYVKGDNEIRMGKYELWMPDNSKTINFLGGGADYLMGENSEMSLTVAVGSTINLPKNLWVRDGYDFVGWTDGEKTYAEGDKYTITKDSISLKAKWKAKAEKMLKYDYSYKNDEYESFCGERIVLPSIAEKAGYEFMGWEIEGKSYLPGTIYIMADKDITAKAVWREIKDYGLLANAVGAWELGEGGTAGYANSAIGGSALESKWTVWLNNETFGRVADFSTEGSYLSSTSSGARLGSNFTVSAWVNAPIRENADRVIISQSGEPKEKQSKTDMVQLFTADDNAGWWGMGPINIGTMAKPKEGRGYLEATEDDLVVFCCTPQFNLKKYFDNEGSLRLWVYVEDAASLDTTRGGAIDLSSDGGQGGLSYTWQVTGLNDGWNEVIIPLKSAMNAKADVSAINYFRFYHYLLDEVTLGVDSMYIFTEEDTTPEDGWSLYVNGSNGELQFKAEGLTVPSSGKKIVDGKWHQVGVSYDGSTLTYYVDREAAKTVSVKGTIATFKDDLYIGNTSTADKNFDGSIAEVRIFNEALPIDKVTTTVIKASDNEAKMPVLNVSKGIVMERFQGANLGRNSYEVYNPNREIHGVTTSNITASKALGFDHVKITVTPNNMIDAEGHLIKENAIYMTEDVDEILSYGLPVLICFHPEPDYKNVYLGNLKNFELLCNWYKEVAAYIGAHWDEDQVLIQLMTEPYANLQTVSWNWYSDRMYIAVRNELPNHTIITSSDSSGNIECLKAMSPATDSNLIYSFTTYEPYTIGFNSASSGMGGVTGYDQYVKNVPYPVPEGLTSKQINDMVADICENVPAEMKSTAEQYIRAYLSGKFDNNPFYSNHYDIGYTSEWNMKRMNSLKAWSDRYGGNIHMMCVEFGCMDSTTAKKYFGAQPYAGVSDEIRIQLVTDLRTAFEANGIGWDYWYFDGVFTVFKPETRVMHAVTDNAYIRENYDADLIEKALGLTPDYSWEK